MLCNLFSQCKNLYIFQLLDCLIGHSKKLKNRSL